MSASFDQLNPVAFFLGSRRHVSTQQGGFTLAELLFGIAIGAVLAALLYPALTMLQAQKRQTICASNVRTVLGATLAYTTDHGGRFPLTYTPKAGTEDEYEITGKSLWDLLNPHYIEKKRTVYCPIRPKDFRKPANVAGEPYSYAYNIGLAKQFPSFGTVNAPHHRVVLISELNNNTNFSTVNHLNNTMNRGRDLGTPDFPINAQYHGSKARRGLNMGFLDGHVELIRPENNDFGHASPNGYGNATNGGYFYAESQFKKIRDGDWIIQ